MSSSESSEEYYEYCRMFYSFDSHSPSMQCVREDNVPECTFQSATSTQKIMNADGNYKLMKSQSREAEMNAPQKFAKPKETHTEPDTSPRYSKQMDNSQSHLKNVSNLSTKSSLKVHSAPSGFHVNLGPTNTSKHKSPKLSKYSCLTAEPDAELKGFTKRPSRIPQKETQDSSHCRKLKSDGTRQRQASVPFEECSLLYNVNNISSPNKSNSPNALIGSQSTKNFDGSNQQLLEDSTNTPKSSSAITRPITISGFNSLMQKRQNPERNKPKGNDSITTTVVKLQKKYFNNYMKSVQSSNSDSTEQASPCDEFYTSRSPITPSTKETKVKGQQANQLSLDYTIDSKEFCDEFATCRSHFEDDGKTMCGKEGTEEWVTQHDDLSEIRHSSDVSSYEKPETLQRTIFFGRKNLEEEKLRTAETIHLDEKEDKMSTEYLTQNLTANDVQMNHLNAHSAITKNSVGIQVLGMIFSMVLCKMIE